MGAGTIVYGIFVFACIEKILRVILACLAFVVSHETFFRSLAHQIISDFLLVFFRKHESMYIFCDRKVRTRAGARLRGLWESQTRRVGVQLGFIGIFCLIFLMLSQG